MVFEWVDGENMTLFSSHIKNKKIKFEEEDFVRMMLIFLYELQKLHEGGVLHRDIKLENLMFYFRNQNFYFLFVDFGISFLLNRNFDSQKCFVVKDRFKSPETNTSQEDFKSDLFSLGVSFNFLLDSLRIDVSSSLLELISLMTIEDHEARCSLSVCIKNVTLYSLEKNYKSEISSFLLSEESSFFQPRILSNQRLEELRMRIEETTAKKSEETNESNEN